MRQALRSLLKAREFTCVAVAIIAIGIGANTAVFSVVDAALLRPLPFKDADRLFILSGTNRARAIVDAPFSHPAFVELAARERMLAGLAAVANERFNETGQGQPQQLSGARVSGSFFDLLGVDMSAGRSFTPDEDRAGAPGVIVLGRRFWSTRFGAGHDAIGASLVLNGAPYTVVGALGIDLPPPFDDVDVWATRPEAIAGFTPAQIDAGLGYLTALARVPPGLPVAQVQAEIDAIAHGYARAHPTNTDGDPNASLRLVPIRDRSVGTSRAPLLLLMGAVGLVLLIACANVSNLLLVRATARSHEAAVRTALGASRMDLVRWMCGESAILSSIGGAFGILIAFWSVAAAASALRNVPRGSEVAVNGRALVFSCAVSFIAAIIFGLLPASIAARQAPADALKSGGRSVAGRRRGARHALVTAEVALSLMLLVGAGLLLQSFARLTHVAVGFAPDGLLTMRVSLPNAKYGDAAAMRTFIDRATARLARVPGVSSAAAAMALPPAVTTMAPFLRGDEPMRPIGDRPVGQWSAVTPGYFATLRIPIVAGRDISERDGADAPLVVVVSEGLARRAWPAESAVGKRLWVGRFPGFAEVVGVAGDVKNNGIGREPLPAMYTPYAQRPWPAMQFAVRAAGGDAAGLASAVRAAFAEVDRDLPITRVQAMDAALAESIAAERLLMTLLSAFAAVAVVMAAAGLYGVIAYGVAQRTQEIGVRVALGASPATVIRLVAADGIRVTLIGIAIGTAGAALVSRALASVLFEVSPADPFTYGAVILLFAAASAAALTVPAVRALRVDPLTALRTE